LRAKNWPRLIRRFGGKYGIRKSKRHVGNCSDFASSIAQELLQTDAAMVSFDVVSLFTKFQFNWH